jgi:hypothetical protein
VGIELLVTDRDLTVVGDPIVGWQTVDCTQRFNTPGSGQFTAPGHQWIREQIEASYRVVVVRDGDVFLSGPIEDSMYERSDDGENGGDGTLTVTFADDLSLVVARQTYPNPALTPEAQTLAEWTFTGTGEMALRTLANGNAGPTARSERRVPHLILGALMGVGTTVTARADLMEPLGDVLRRVASSGGNLGFRTRQVGKQILFEVYAPTDKSNIVRFGFGLGNLRYLGYQRSAPKATTAIVGGQGEGADRALIARTDATAETAWGRREMLVNRSGTTPAAELQQAGDEALTEAGETARVQSSAYDSDDQRYGVHYGLGDRVSIQIWPGYEVSDLVRLVHLQAWATSGELVSAMVGSQEASHDPKWIQMMRQVDRRVGRIERIVKPSA